MLARWIVASQDDPNQAAGDYPLTDNLDMIADLYFTSRGDADVYAASLNRQYGPGTFRPYPVIVQREADVAELAEDLNR